MSFCRWSCMDYTCDLYVYEHVHGYIAVEVASSRPKMDLEALPPKVSPITDTDAFFERQDAVLKMVKNVEREQLDMKYAGQSFQFCDLDECAEFLANLRVLGYNFPVDLVERIYE